MENEDLGPTTGLDTQPSMGYDQYLPQVEGDDTNTPDAGMEGVDGMEQGGGSEAPSGPEINPTPFQPEPQDETVGPLPDVPVAPYNALLRNIKTGDTAHPMDDHPEVPQFNRGGSVLRMNDAGEVLNHPFDREGKDFDTIDAKLTPGEMVIDADSTYALQQVAPGFLKDLNEWEPNDGVDSLTSILKDVVISPKGEEMVMTKKMEDGKEITIKSGKDHEMRGDDEHASIVHRVDGTPGVNGEPGAVPTTYDAKLAQGGAEADSTGSSRSAGSLGSVRSQFVKDYAGQQAAYQATAADRAAQKKKDEEKTANTKIAQSSADYAVKAIQSIYDGAGEAINMLVDPTINRKIKLAVALLNRASGATSFSMADAVRDETRSIVPRVFGSDNVVTTEYSKFESDIQNLYLKARNQLRGQGQVSDGEAETVYRSVATATLGPEAVVAALTQYLGTLEKEEPGIKYVIPNVVPIKKYKPTPEELNKVDDSLDVSDLLDSINPFGSKTTTSDKPKDTSTTTPETPTTPDKPMDTPAVEEVIKNSTKEDSYPDSYKVGQTFIDGDGYLYEFTSPGVLTQKNGISLGSYGAGGEYTLASGWVVYNEEYRYLQVWSRLKQTYVPLQKLNPAGEEG